MCLSLLSSPCDDDDDDDDDDDVHDLQLMSPQLDMKTLVSAVGSCILEIQKK